jgi:hypothetical protein
LLKVSEWRLQNAFTPPITSQSGNNGNGS